MSIVEILNANDGKKHFSFEVLPPLKGTGTDRLFSTIEKFREFDPAYINITTHHSEFVYRELANGQYERLRVRRRPGTVAKQIWHSCHSPRDMQWRKCRGH